MPERKEERRTVRIFSLASFLNDMGSDMIAPVWPLFITVFLGANMAVLGFIDGLGDAIVSISQAASGYLSDRWRKRKVFIWAGYTCAGISRIGYALSTAWQHVVPFKVLDRAGKIRDAPRDAIIADVSTIRTRGRNFGFLEMMDNLGAVTGIVISVLLFGILGFQRLMLLAAIPSLIGVLLIILLIKERKANKIHRGISFKDLDRNYLLFLLLSAVFALGYFSYSFFLVFAANSGFHLTTVPVLYLLFTLIAAISSFPFGKLADRIGRKWVLWIGFALFGLMNWGFTLSPGILGIIALFALYGLQKGAMKPMQKAYTSELAPKRFRASALGAYKMVVGLMALPASVIAGLLWVFAGMQAPFMFSAILSLITTVLLIFVKETAKF